MSERPYLPPRDQRPPITPALASFRDAISEINDFYWVVLAGLDSLRRLRPTSATAPADFVAAALAAHLNLPLNDFDSLLDEQPRRLHYLCVVDAVTFYEEFLLQTLLRELPCRPEFNKDKPTVKQAKKVINGDYETRPEDIDRALGIDVTSVGTEHELVVEDLKATFLARNCIVHSGGVVTDRELGRLGTMVSPLKRGDRLPIDEALWRRLCASLWRHAQDVDLLTRVRS